MAVLYPNALDALPTGHTDNTNEVVHAATDNDQSDAINQIERELGILPKGSYASVAARLAALEYPVVENHNVIAYSLLKADKNKIKSFINAGACVVTVPTQASQAWDLGTVIQLRQGSSAGTVSVVGASGVTVLSRNASLSLAGPVAYATLFYLGSDTWDLFGDLA